MFSEYRDVNKHADVILRMAVVTSEQLQKGKKRQMLFNSYTHNLEQEKQQQEHKAWSTNIHQITIMKNLTAPVIFRK